MKKTISVDKDPWKPIERLGIVVAVTAGLVGLANDLLQFSGSVIFLRLISAIGYAAVVAILLGYRSRLEPASRGRSAILAALVLWTAGFFTWVGTWTIPPQVVADARAFAVEQGSPQAILYEGEEYGELGTGELMVTSRLVDRHIRTIYDLEYTITEEGSYAGFSLYFAQPLDVSAYKYLEFNVTLFSPDARFRVVMKESNENIYDLVMVTDMLEKTTQEQTVRLSLDEVFSAVNHKDIRKIDFDVNDSFTTGHHTFRVSDIRFVR